MRFLFTMFAIGREGSKRLQTGRMASLGWHYGMPWKPTGLCNAKLQSEDQVLHHTLLYVVGESKGNSSLQ
jgi:hypothetical protein